MRDEKVILLTGYEPFDKLSYNPSGVIAQALDSYSPAAGYVVRGVQMPVDCEKMPKVLAGLWEQHQPICVIGLGLALSATGLQIERLGKNWVEIAAPDNGKHTRAGELLLVDAPTAYRTTLPVKTILTALLEAGIPAYLSDDAGAHMCNGMLFTALHLAAQQQPAPRCGFIHLPGVPKLVAEVMAANRDKRHTASMSLDLMQEGVKVVLAQSLT